MKHRRTEKEKRACLETADLIAALRMRIASGKLGSGDLLPTVRGLSRQERVAHGTAWKALKALEAEGLAEARPRRGYRVSARPVPRPGTGTVAYVMDQRNVILVGSNALYLRLLDELETGAGRTETRLAKLIMAPGQEEMIIAQLTASKPEGLVLDSTNDRLLDWAAQSCLPAIVADDWRSDLRVDSVVQDGFDGGYLAARRLLDEGCERIAWLGYMDHLHGLARYGGASAALAAAGKRFSHEENADFAPPAQREAAVRVLSGPSRPDGVLAFWRPSCAPLLQAARAAGLELGRSLKMVGWCPRELIGETYAPLFGDATPPPAVTWSIRSMAEIALSRLAERRRNPALPVTSLRVPVSIQSFSDENRK